MEQAAYQIRRLSIEMITYAKWGHPGGSFSMAEILAVLYFQIMHIDPENPKWEGRDRLILSKAHGSPALYAALALRGFFPLEDIYTYCELDGSGRTYRHDPHAGARIIRWAAWDGPFRCRWDAPGPASPRKSQRQRVFCILGDGELNEGNVWEAAMAAAHYHLDNLIAIVDYNKVMAKGFVWDLMSIEPLVDKWTAFGWDVIEVDGHDIGGHRRTPSTRRAGYNRAANRSS